MYDAVSQIREEYLRRRKKNPNYSMRAFASSVDVSPGALSDIFARKRPLTRPMAERIAAQLYSDPKEVQNFLAKIQGTEVRAALPKQNEDRELELSEATIALMSELLYFQLLGLFETSDFRSDPSWMASRLKQPVPRIQQLLERLVYLGFVEWREDSYALTTGRIRTKNELSSAAVRSLQKDILSHVIDKMDTVDLAHRDVQSLTLPIGLDKLPAAKLLIDAFINTLSHFLMAGESTEVYHLNVQLFPATDVRT